MLAAGPAAAWRRREQGAAGGAAKRRRALQREGALSHRHARPLAAQAAARPWRLLNPASAHTLPPRRRLQQAPGGVAWRRWGAACAPPVAPLLFCCGRCPSLSPGALYRDTQWAHRGRGARPAHMQQHAPGGRRPGTAGESRGAAETHRALTEKAKCLIPGHATAPSAAPPAPTPLPTPSAPPARGRLPLCVWTAAAHYSAWPGSAAKSPPAGAARPRQRRPEFTRWARLQQTAAAPLLSSLPTSLMTHSSLFQLLHMGSGRQQFPHRPP